MTGFEPGSSQIISDRSANCATTTSPSFHLLVDCFFLLFVNFVWPINFESQQVENISTSFLLQNDAF